MYDQDYEMKYHGDKFCSPYFEGWYFKIVTKDAAFAVIAGIAKTATQPHVFIQTIDTISKKTQYKKYPIEEAVIKEHPFALLIGNNMFSKQHLRIHLDYFEADLYQYEFTELHTNRYAPTIMGPFSYLKHMQCIHSIISLHHYVRGVLFIEKQPLNIYGIGYMEKDRGVSFPSNYLWAQASDNSHCIFLSMAHIPLQWFSFHGCICVLLINGKQYRFTSYYGVRIIKKEIKNDHHQTAKLELQQFAYHLEIEIVCYHAYPLLAPKEGVMEHEIMESLESTMKVKLYHHRKLLYVHTFEHAGCEIHMD